MKWSGDFFFKFYWHIVDLECYVRLRYTAKWLSCVCIYIYTHTYVYIFFSTIGYYRYWIYFPVLYRSLLVIYFVYSSMCVLGLPRWLSGKESACNARDTGGTGLIPGSGRSLEEGMATHCSILAWRIPWTEEPGGLQSMGSQRVEHNRTQHHLAHRCVLIPRS